MRFVAILMLVATTAAADPTPAPFRDVDALIEALPAGWRASLTRGTDGRGQLAIRRTDLVRPTGVQFRTAYITNVPQPAPREDAPQIALALVFRVEPRWTEPQYEHARAVNAILYRALAELRGRHPTDDAEYTREAANLMSKLVQLPRCTLGTLSVFDGEHTYEQLGTTVEPAKAMREAFAIAELFKRRCR